MNVKRQLELLQPLFATKAKGIALPFKGVVLSW